MTKTMATATTRTKTVTTTALAAAVAGAVSFAAPVSAQGPPMHQVRYTVTSDAPHFARIYYRNVEPAVFSDYSHNPFIFSPKAEVEIGPDRPWVLDAQLADPTMWAMVTVQSAESAELATPASALSASSFSCELSVDGVVVKTNSGSKGALCSIRNW
ncbi:hypothetical protein C6A87_018970 [Mycobacterium sp. ITM-2016-00317]|uniref:hypothetical protein n=1 Tax=Mycobacterium sp. ITM-2016-00317 TaxID=2099694 RepID=UPI00287FB7D1|nr:hypothetical protein [Mycobacterium sp. ITM-2016-00317]WNG85981.1 hypothetical protein C6A87_018970 [Mycobacterium sp. ITM-2016-00317]